MRFKNYIKKKIKQWLKEDRLEFMEYLHQLDSSMFKTFLDSSQLADDVKLETINPKEESLHTCLGITDSRREVLLESYKISKITAKDSPSLINACNPVHVNELFYLSYHMGYDYCKDSKIEVRIRD